MLPESFEQTAQALRGAVARSGCRPGGSPSRWHGSSRGHAPQVGTRGRHKKRHKKHAVDQAEALAVGMAVPRVTPRRSNRRGCRRGLLHASPAAAGAMCRCRPDQQATVAASSDAGGRSRASLKPEAAETAVRSLVRRGQVSQAEAPAVGKAFLRGSRPADWPGDDADRRLHSTWCRRRPVIYERPGPCDRKRAPEEAGR